jgi:hypothetical protein
VCRARQLPLFTKPIHRKRCQWIVDACGRRWENAARWGIGEIQGSRLLYLVHFSPEVAIKMSESKVLANQKQILKNQKAILGNQGQIKANQETIKKNQGAILKNQKQILAAVKK